MERHSSVSVSGIAALLALGPLLTACSDDPASCNLARPCPLGSYCEGGTCHAECDPATPTCPGGVCTRFGRCVPDEPDPDAGICAALVLDASFGIPTVALLVDQSGSMTEAYSGGTRWTVLRSALIDPTDGVVTRLQSTMRFGLTLYTNTGGPTCPALTVVDPALDNRDAIAVVYDAERPEADTPTGESIDAVVQALQAVTEPGAKYIILASDGEPDTCAQPNPQEGQPEAVAAAQAAHAAGIDLFFLSVGSGTISQAHMQDVANAGVGYPIGGDLNAPYYEAGDAEQLAAAFDEITSRMFSCELTVNGVIASDAETSGVIYLDSAQLTLHEQWEPIDESSFRLLGEACDAAQRAGEHTVTAHFGCESSAPPGELSAEGGGFVDGGCSSVRPVWLGCFLAVGALVRFRRRSRL